MSWWVSILLSPTLFAVFQFPDISPVAFKSFLLPDLILVAGLSLVRAYLPKRSLEWLILGAFGFGTLYCLNAAVLTGGGLLSTTLMIFGLCFNLFLVFNDRLFRVSNTKSQWRNGIKTLIQILLVWGLTLVIIPGLILYSFKESFYPPAGGMIVFGSALLVGFSCLGLWSAISMVYYGKGTPLPVDQTNRLVIQGPYQIVRNPMALAGMGQGLGVCLIFASWPMTIYTLLGGLLWHFVVRPIEERNLELRFGQPYIEYKASTPLWLPKIKS